MSRSLLLVMLALSKLCIIQTQASGALAQRYDHDCDRVVRLRLNESFHVSAFPPSPQLFGYDAYDRLRNPYRSPQPRECSWVFEGRGCQLEFHQRISAFQRGDVDCDEQYFLIGDENREERKPPRVLNSTGTRLFMTHFARNGRHGYAQETIASRMNGVVRCSALPSHSRVCAPTLVSCSNVTSPECAAGSCSTTLLIFALPAQNQTEFLDCHPVTGKKCQGIGQMCFGTVPVNSALPPLEPVAPVPGANCSLPGTCSAIFSWGFGPFELTTFNRVNSTCIAEPECVCVFQGNSCFVTK